MCVQARLDEVHSAVAFDQRQNPEQHDAARRGWKSDPADPGPSGKESERVTDDLGL